MWAKLENRCAIIYGKALAITNTQSGKVTEWDHKRNVSAERRQIVTLTQPIRLQTVGPCQCFRPNRCGVHSPHRCICKCIKKYLCAIACVNIWLDTALALFHTLQIIDFANLGRDNESTRTGVYITPKHKLWANKSIETRSSRRNQSISRSHYTIGEWCHHGQLPRPIS